MIFRDAKGFSLIELFSVVAVMSILLYSSLEAINWRSKQISSAGLETAKVDLSDEIRKFLMVPGICRKNFETRNSGALPWNVGPLLDDTGTAKYSVGDLLGEKKIRIVAMRVENFVPIEDFFGTASLVIDFEQTREKIGGQRQTRRIGLYFRLNSPHPSSVIECNLSGDADDPCSAFGGRVITSADGSRKACAMDQTIVTDHADPHPPEAIVYTSSSGADAKTTGFASKQGEFWSTGGETDHQVKFANTSNSATGGFAFIKAEDSANAPYPAPSPNAHTLVIHNDGRVGVGGYTFAGEGNPTPTDPNGKLYVQGDQRIEGDLYTTVARASGTVFAAGGAAYLSDARFKSDIRPIEAPRSRLRGISGVRFHWDPSTTGELRVNHNEGDIGFIAQEVRTAIPEAVREGSDGYLWMNYSKMTPVTIEALKETRAELRGNRARLDRIRFKDFARTTRYPAGRTSSHPASSPPPMHKVPSRSARGKDSE